MARCRLLADIRRAAAGPRDQALLRTAVPPIVLLLCAAVLPGQSADVLGKRNAAFLNGLWQAGYVEYADKIGQLVAASNLPADEKKVVEAAHTKLKIAIAAQKGDAKERRDLVLKVIDEKTALLGSATPGSEAAVELLGELVDQYRLLADAVSEMLAQEKDPAAQVEIRKAAVERFTAAQADLKDRKKAYAPLRSDDKPGSEVPLLVAFYGLGKVCYYQALIHPAESLAAKHLIEESVTTLEDFDLEFGDTLAGFEAKLMMALCQKRLGDAATALDLCDDSIALRERFDHDKKTGIYQVDPNAADVIAAAVLQKTLFLKDQNEHGKIVDVTKDYFATIPQGLEAMQGKAVLAAQGDAYFMLGDSTAATAVAQKLIETDPKGFWGYRGQQLLSNLIASGRGGVGTEKVLKTAESLAGQGEFERALQMCRETVLQAKTPEDMKFAAEAMLITGAIYATRGWFHEAAVAFDAVVRRYPKSEVAPDALWRAIQCFIELDETDKLPMFKRLIDERSRQLVRDYPTDAHVGHLQLLEGQRLDRAGKALEAAAVYEKISSDSVVHLDARYYAASAYQRHARKLENGSQPKEAEPFSQKALNGFLSVLQDAASAKTTVPDIKVKARIEQVEFGARIALANLYLSGTPKPAEAEKILKPITLSDDDKQAPKLWALRIRVKLEEGKVDDAAAEMQAALDKAPESRDLVAACRSLASTLDNRAVERSKAKDRIAANNIWKQATSYYLRSATGASNAEVAQIAERLRVIGLIANEVGENVEGWFELPDFKAKDTTAWQGALDLFRRLADSDAMTHKARLGRASILGYLGKWDECEAELAKVFEENNILGANQRLDNAALQKKPELLNAYLEWAFALRMPTGSAEEKARRARASERFDRVIRSVSPEHNKKQWWFSRYGQIQTLFDRGLYDEADVSLSSLERTNQDFDGDQFQLKQRFKKLKTDIALKIPPKKK